MFVECTKISTGDFLLSVLKLVEMNFAGCTKSSKDQSLQSVLKLVKMNVSPLQ